MSRPPRRPVFIPAAVGPSSTAAGVYVTLARWAPTPIGRRLHPQLGLPPLEDIAVRAGVSVRSVKRSLAELRAAGWIVTERRGIPGRHGGQLRGQLHAALVMPVDSIALQKGRAYVGPPIRSAP